jgi:hypothetical protein
VVVRGGVEPPTFRFSGVANGQLGPATPQYLPVGGSPSLALAAHVAVIDCQLGCPAYQLARSRTPVLLIIASAVDPAVREGARPVKMQRLSLAGSGFASERRQSLRLQVSDLGGHAMTGLTDGLLFRHRCGAVRFSGLA